MELFTVKEVASRLKMSESLVYQLVEQGRLACHRVGQGRGRIRISEEDLAEYLAGCRQESGIRVHRPRARPRLKHLKL